MMEFILALALWVVWVGAGMLVAVMTQAWVKRPAYWKYLLITLVWPAWAYYVLTR